MDRRTLVLTLDSLSLVGILGALLLFLVTVGLNLLQPQVSPIRDPISSLALGRGGILLEYTFALAGLATVALAAGLHRGIRNTTTEAAATALLVVGGAEVALLGLFPTDPTVVPTTVAGQVHFILAGSGFLLMGISFILYTHTFQEDRHWNGYRRPATWLAWSTVALFAVQAALVLREQVSVRINGYVGIAQRLLVVAILAWVLATCMALRRVARDPAHLVEKDGKVVVD